MSDVDFEARAEFADHVAAPSEFCTPASGAVQILEGAGSKLVAVDKN